MTRTVIVTGSSTGIGKATVLRLHKAGWQVVASMRTPEAAAWIPTSERFLAPRLDVTDRDSIRLVLDEAIERFGRIDAVVNNAGYGLVGPFEASTHEQVERQFATNVFGLMNVVREILPHMRESGGGTILNVSSVGGRITFPLYSVYHATKWAVEGFSESLQFELRQFNIHMKIVEPGPIRTEFYDRSYDRSEQGVRQQTPKDEQRKRVRTVPELPRVIVQCTLNYLRNELWARGGLA